MKGINPQFTSISQVTDQFLNPQSKPVTKVNDKGLSFREVLEQTRQAGLNEPLKFSKHASARLSDRNLELSDAQMMRLEEGANKAREKGINESLVIVDDLAFIVNVPNKTVITAINQNEANENVFTNIDGAVII